ncbi:MAG: glycosyltransferase family 39 protein [Phycisphaerae bacterium]
MSPLTVDPQSEAVASHGRAPGAARYAWRALASICIVALWMRCWNSSGPFPSNDHCQLAYFCTHHQGWRWCLTTHYGPLQPFLVKLFATLVTGLGFAMTEFLWRLPMALAGAALPWPTFFLARRLSDSRPAAWTAAALAAGLPALVTDARYPWAYETLGTLCAALALLATLRYLERDSRARAALLGAALALYLASHLLIHALPVVVLLLLLAGGPRRLSAIPRIAERLQRLARFALLAPVALMLLAIVFAFVRLDGGPIERLMQKAAVTHRAAGDSGGLRLLAIGLRGNLGWPLAIAAAAVMVGAIRGAVRPRRPLDVIAWWPVLFCLPWLVLSFPTGRPLQYLTQPAYALALLTACRGVPWLCGRIGTVAGGAMAAAVVLVTAAGAIDANFYAGRFAGLTGARADWGAARPDSGLKAAADYVRANFAADAVVATLHDSSGGEFLNAAYYFGRFCLAYTDLTPAESAALLARFADRVDVVVCERRLGLSPSWANAIPLVARVQVGGAAAIDIYARRLLQLPPMTVDAAVANAEFDHQFAPRTLGERLAWPAGLPPYREIAAAVEQLRSAPP